MLKFFKLKSGKDSSAKVRGIASEPAATQRRRKMKAAMPRTVLRTEHTAGSALLPTRRALLERIPQGGVASEIGVSRGEFTREILQFNKPSKLHLVDAWSSSRYASHLDEVRAAFGDELASGKVEINQGLSTEVLPRFADFTFDWVYIDTDHSYDTTAAELEICKRKIKPGGRIAGHDFCTGNVVTPVPYGVIEACNDFCVRESWRYEYVTLDPDGHFSFCLVKMD